MSESQTTERIIIPSKYKCEKHNYYSDEKPCEECFALNTLKVSELNNKTNLVFAVIIEDGMMKKVINTNDVGVLSIALRQMDKAVDFVLFETEKAKMASAIQTAPASVLNKLRG